MLSASSASSDIKLTHLVFCYYQIEEIRSAFSKSRLIGLSFLIAFEKGTLTIWSFWMPIITLRCPSINASTAATPIRVARIRSCAVGEPPRCKCPKIETRTSNCGYSRFTRSATPSHFAFCHQHDTTVLRLAETGLDHLCQLVFLQ